MDLSMDTNTEIQLKIIDLSKYRVVSMPKLWWNLKGKECMSF